MNPQVEFLLKSLSKMIREGILTKAQCIDDETFICLTCDNPGGKVYHQTTFEQMPKEWQAVLKYRKIGETVAHLKVVAVFDVWPSEISLPTIPKAS